MKYFYIVVGIFLSLFLSACTTTHLDPAMASVTKSYFVKSVTITNSKEFAAQISSASYFNAEVQAGLSKDLPGLLHGKLPAVVNVQMTSYQVGNGTFQSPTTTVTGVVSIVDAANGATISQVDILADDREMATRRNNDPLAALGAELLVAAVSPKTNLRQKALAGAFQAKVKQALGGSGLF